MPDKPKRGFQNGVLAGVSLVSMFVTAIIVVMAFQALTAPTPTPAAPTAQYDYDGATPIDPPRPMPDFTLTDQNGKATKLSDLRGKPSLLFFGFTHCPDFCPTTMSEYRAIQRELGDKGSAVNFVFISVDGDRDTPDVIKDFFRVRRADDFIGLTGKPEDVRRIAADYGVQIEFSEKAADGTYDVTHTPSMFLLNPDGAWIVKFDFGTEVDVITAELNPLIP